MRRALNVNFIAGSWGSVMRMKMLQTCQCMLHSQIHNKGIELSSTPKNVFFFSNILICNVFMLYGWRISAEPVYILWGPSTFDLVCWLCINVNPTRCIYRYIHTKMVSERFLAYRIQTLVRHMM